MRRPKKISIREKSDGSLEVLERPVKDARVFEEVLVDRLDQAAWIKELNSALEKDIEAMSKAKKHSCEPGGLISVCRDCALEENFEMAKRTTEKLREAKKHRKVLPRRPLAVGDRVSFEGYALPQGHAAVVFIVGKGTLRFVTATRALVRGDSGLSYSLGLHSFRRLVKKGKGK